MNDSQRPARRRRLVSAVLAGALTALCGAAGGSTSAAAVQCPAQLALSQSTEAAEPWQQRALASHARLAEVLLLDGHPDEGVTMMVDEELTEGGEWIQRWQLPGSPRGYWLACRYQGSLVELVRPLPEAVSVCEVAWDRGARFSGNALPRRAVCR